jgi:hypothetical protein
MHEQDKKIAAIEEKIKDFPSNFELMVDLSANIGGLRTDIQGILLLPEKLEQFSKPLELATNLFRQPREAKVIHHHHVPKLIWIAGGLFLGFCVVFAGWYVTASKLDNFIVNDTKYRKLRVDTAQRGLQLYLDHLDSLFKVETDMRENVLETEEQFRVNFERLHKAERLKRDADDLEKAAGTKKINIQ